MEKWNAFSETLKRPLYLVQRVLVTDNTVLRLNMYM